MLRPTKHTHPDKTVINVAVFLLEKLRKNRIEQFSELYSFVKNQLKDCESLFIPALDFLFILGAIEYRPKIDSFEYVAKK